MADGTHIEWTDATANVVNGCSVVSPGCTNCYAMRLAGTRLRHHPSRRNLTNMSKAGPVWNGITRFWEPALQQVLHWRRPRRIFWNAHGDLFHESVPLEWIDRCLAVMALTGQHTHQLLTKRPQRAFDYFTDAGGAWNWKDKVRKLVDELKPSSLWNGSAYQAKYNLEKSGILPNVWLGTSTEDQERAEERIPILLETPAAVHWISAEPLLGPLNLRHIDVGFGAIDALSGGIVSEAHIDWVVVGGESGPGARPMHPDWARSLRDQCAQAGVAFLFKQWGAWLPGENDGSEPLARWQDGQLGRHSSSVDERKAPEWRHFGTPGDPGAFAINVGKKAAGRLLDSVEHNGYPA